nr:ABC transporter ATP-binding protein [Microbacterium rhizomatis]
MTDSLPRHQPAPAPVGGAATVPTPAPTPAPTIDSPAPDAALQLEGLVKRFGDKVAVDGISLTVPSGSFYGLVGPNGAGKTTSLSMATGLLMPDAGRAIIHGVDVWREPVKAKAMLGNLADGVKLFDRLTGEQLVTYNGLLFGISHDEIARRTADLLALMDMTAAAGTLVVDYSAGMTKKIALACALVHAPRVLVLDEPFESVDPVSAANIQDVLTGYVGSGGTVIVSSHSMDLVQRLCDHVAVISAGRLLVAGTVDEVRAGESLQDRFVDLVGGRRHSEGPEWLRRS